MVWNRQWAIRGQLACLAVALSAGLATPGWAQSADDAAAQDTGDVAPVESAAPDEEPATTRSVPATEDPDWFSKMLARTVEPLPMATVASDDGFFTASLPARLIGPMESTDEFYLMNLDFGPGPTSTAGCYVFRRDLDLSGSLLLFSDKLFEAVGKTLGEIEAKSIYAVDAGGIGSSPYLGLDWLYRGGEEDGEPVVGHIKHLIASKQGRALYCQNTAVGYDDAFFHLFQYLVGSVEFADAAESTPFYEALSLVDIGGQVVGLARTTHRIDGDGDIEAKGSVSLLVPVDEQTLQSSDTVSIEHSTVAGDLISSMEVVASAGNVINQWVLSRTEAGGWQVEGSSQGKEVKADLGEAAPLSDLQQRLALRDFLAGEGSVMVAQAEETAEPVLAFQEWAPDWEPTLIATTEITHRGVGDVGEALHLRSKGLAFTAEADEHRSLIAIRIPLDATTMALDQIFVRGDAFYPLELAAEARETANQEMEAQDIEPPAEIQGDTGVSADPGS